MIKYGLIRDADFFEWLLAHVEALTARDGGTLAYAIQRVVRSKLLSWRRMSGGGVRALILGIRLGMRSSACRPDCLHGAVAAGMVIASQISVQRGTLDASIVEKLITFNRAVVARRGAVLPVCLGSASGHVKRLKRSAREKFAIFCCRFGRGGRDRTRHHGRYRLRSALNSGLGAR